MRASQACGGESVDRDAILASGSAALERLRTHCFFERLSARESALFAPVRTISRLSAALCCNTRYAYKRALKTRHFARDVSALR